MPLCICWKFQCKEWGFLLKKLFGVHLGTGDYGHLVIGHSAMLLRQFRSLYKYSGQGFEASHKLHRNLYSKATNHDASAPGQSRKFSLEIKSQFQSFIVRLVLYSTFMKPLDYLISLET